ncbi:MAG: hypothetical protein JO363_14035, partial [Solirubrobacterales bacterium]|nr:hypothetical protein [Solirubrobacterales bacterium]
HPGALGERERPAARRELEPALERLARLCAALANVAQRGGEVDQQAGVLEPERLPQAMGQLLKTAERGSDRDIWRAVEHKLDVIRGASEL